MAVLTRVDDKDAEVLAARYGLPAIERIDPIPAGSVNSNFAVRAGERQLFLRIYEERDLAGAQREAALLERLAGAGVPTPAPLPMRDGRLVSSLRGKAAAVFPWRSGRMRCQASVTPEDARRVGEALARVHVAGGPEEAEEGRFRAEDLALRLDRIAREGEPVLAAAVPELRDELKRAHGARDRSLPGGLTHGDLFRDNVLWAESGEISALLDFESACAGTYAYDLMVTVLAWCVGDDVDPVLARAMGSGYDAVRPLRESERRALAAEATFAALRFTITRITDFAMRTNTGAPQHMKDWRRFRMRFLKLQSLGHDGVRRLVGL